MFPSLLPSFLQSYKIGGIKPTLHRLGLEGYDVVTEAGPLEVTGGIQIRGVSLQSSLHPNFRPPPELGHCICGHLSLLPRSPLGREQGERPWEGEAERAPLSWLFILSAPFQASG